MIKKITNKLWRVKAAVLACVVVATVFGTSTAMAGTGVGAVFNLGEVNSVLETTILRGDSSGFDGQLLRLSNDSTGTSATALRLNVGAGRPPLTVNSTAGTATDLSADELDGKDSAVFLEESERNVRYETISVPAHTVKTEQLQCAGSDDATGGGFDQLNSGTRVIGSRPDSFSAGTWWVTVENTSGNVDTVNGYVVCY